MQVGRAEKPQATIALKEPVAMQEKKGASKTRGALEASAISSPPSVPTVLTLLHLAAYVVVGGASGPHVTAAIAAGATVVSAEMAGEHQNTDTPSPAHNPAMFPYPG